MNITDVKARLSEVVDRVQAGEDVIILRMGRPVARLTAQVPAEGARRFGLLPKSVTLPDDWDTWPDEEARALGIID
jgi:antitoxin (DNA-binding transcriptional repressor) of toxin-antitoxin stability system